MQANFPVTKPAWYGLWIRSPLDAPAPAAQIHPRNAGGSRQLRPSHESDDSRSRAAYDTLYRCMSGSTSRGEGQGTWWNLVPHCQLQCSWPDAQSNNARCVATRPSCLASQTPRPQHASYWPLERMLKGAPQTSCYAMSTLVAENSMTRTNNRSTRRTVQAEVRLFAAWAVPGAVRGLRMGSSCQLCLFENHPEDRANSLIPLVVFWSRDIHRPGAASSTSWRIGSGSESKTKGRLFSDAPQMPPRE